MYSTTSWWFNFKSEWVWCEISRLSKTAFLVVTNFAILRLFCGIGNGERVWISQHFKGVSLAQVHRKRHSWAILITKQGKSRFQLVQLQMFLGRYILQVHVSRDLTTAVCLADLGRVGGHCRALCAGAECGCLHAGTRHPSVTALSGSAGWEASLANRVPTGDCPTEGTGRFSVGWWFFKWHWFQLFKVLGL